MTADKTVNLPLRAFLLVLTIAAGEAVRIQLSEPGAPEWATLAKSAGPIAIYAMLHAAVLGWFAARSAWPRMRLFGAMFLALFGIQSVLPYAEVLYFGEALPFSPDDVALMPVAALPASALSAAAAVFLFGGLSVRNEPAPVKANASIVSWLWRVAAAGAAYAILYFLAGILIVNVHDFAREFYGNVGASIDPVGLLFFQIARGAVWALMAMPLLASQTTSPWERSNALGAAFVVFVGALLLAENPLLPGQMRMLHLIEISLSNFLFGFVAGYLLTPLVRR